MLERLRIQNFKSWQDTGDMAFGSLTGFFGTNSSGKSSILQFLLMLKQTVESSDRSRVLHLGDDKSYVDLGTTYDILHNHEDPELLKFKFQWKSPILFFDRINKNDNFWKTNSLTFEAEIIREGDNVILIGFQYIFNNKMTGIKLAPYQFRKDEYDTHAFFIHLKILRK